MAITVELTLSGAGFAQAALPNPYANTILALRYEPDPSVQMAVKVWIAPGPMPASAPAAAPAGAQLIADRTITAGEPLSETVNIAASGGGITAAGGENTNYLLAEFTDSGTAHSVFIDVE